MRNISDTEAVTSAPESTTREGGGRMADSLLRTGSESGRCRPASLEPAVLGVRENQIPSRAIDNFVRFLPSGVAEMQGSLARPVVIDEDGLLAVLVLEVPMITAAVCVIDLWRLARRGDMMVRDVEYGLLAHMAHSVPKRENRVKLGGGPVEPRRSGSWQRREPSPMS